MSKKVIKKKKKKFKYFWSLIIEYQNISKAVLRI